MTLLILALLAGLLLGLIAHAKLRMHPLIAAAVLALVVQVVGWLVYGPDKDGHFNALYGFLEAAAAAFAVIVGSVAASIIQGRKESE